MSGTRILAALETMKNEHIARKCAHYHLASVLRYSFCVEMSCDHSGHGERARLLTYTIEIEAIDAKHELSYFFVYSFGKVIAKVVG